MGGEPAVQHDHSGRLMQSTTAAALAAIATKTVAPRFEVPEARARRR